MVTKIFNLDLILNQFEPSHLLQLNNVLKFADFCLSFLDVLLDHFVIHLKFSMSLFYFRHLLSPMS